MPLVAVERKGADGKVEYTYFPLDVCKISQSQMRATLSADDCRIIIAETSKVITERFRDLDIQMKKMLPQLQANAHFRFEIQYWFTNAHTFS